MVIQKFMKLPAFKRGFHLITHLVEKGIPELKTINQGILQVFIQHSSASLSLNENADPTVRQDFESHFNVMVPENAPHYRHTLEG
ncbi:MAG: YjbQ family protein, partial [Spirochaetota bacterium]|nr:YjbQ family protein [Spirochaetota bacterium]